MHVSVWKVGREVRGWDGKPETYEKVIKFPVIDLPTALYSVYKTDAHFCPAVIYQFDAPVDVQPRLNKVSLPELEKAGKTVKFKVIAIDVDAPKKAATPEWRNEQKERVNSSAICSNAIIYDTSGGYRLLWELEKPLTVPQYEKTLEALRDTLTADGIVSDELVDWTRCYRLPKVTRDGIFQDLFLLVPSSFILNESLLVQKSDPFLSAIAKAKTTPTIIEEIVETGGRNDFLFKLASKMRGTNWIPEEMYLPWLLSINQAKCNPPLPEDEVKVIANSVLRYAKEENEDSPKVKVVLKVGALAESVDDTLRILSNTSNDLYHRDGKLVRIIGDKIQLIPKAALRKVLADHVDFIRYNKEGEEIKQDPPMEIVDIIYETGVFPAFRELHELLTLPSLKPDGSLVNTEGYNHELKAYIKPMVSIELEEPTRENAEAALKRLLLIVDQFPFYTEAHRTVSIAAMMTPVLRTAIKGPVPLFIFDSTTPGSGKSLLADIASLIVLGTSAPRMVQTKEEEMEKRITSILLTGARTALIDNIDKPLGGASIDAVLTSEYWTGRFLSKSEMVTLKSIVTWFATGNNITTKGDLPRRAVRCFLDPETERPEERSNFKIQSHTLYIEENRQQIIKDIFTIALAFKAHGSVTVSNFGTFERWSEWVREPLVWLGMEDPVITQKELREDSTLANWGAVLEAAFKIFEDKWFTLKDIYDVAFDGVRKNAEHEAYASLTANISFFSEPNIKQLSWALKSWLQRVVNGKRLLRGDKDRLKGFLYRVEVCEKNSEKLSQVA